VKKALGESFEESLESSGTWHGNVEGGLTRLEMLSVNISDSQKRWKLQGLYDYLLRNREYIVNYHERQDLNKTKPPSGRIPHRFSAQCSSEDREDAMESEGASPQYGQKLSARDGQNSGGKHSQL